MFHAGSTSVPIDNAAAAPARERGEIRTLQYGRGIAALMVCLFHQEVLSQKYFGGLGANGWFFSGHSGVQFFFVVSGFIIFRIHWADIGTPAKLRPYLIKRAIRIYPIFWLITIPVGLAMLFSSSLGTNRDLTPVKFILDLLLVPRTGTLVQPPAWTLQFELVFYLVFAVAILHARIGLILFSVWQLACVAALLFNLIPVGFQNLQPLARLIGHDNLGFVVGMGVAFMHAKIDMARWRPVLLAAGLVGLLGLMAAAYTEGRLDHEMLSNSALESFSFFVLYALIIVGLLAVRNVARPVLDATLGALGAASYVLYLVHEPAGSIVYKILGMGRIRPLMTPHLAYGLSIAFTVAAALLIHYAVERPCLAWLRGKFLPASTRRPRVDAPSIPAA